MILYLLYIIFIFIHMNKWAILANNLLKFLYAFDSFLRSASIYKWSDQDQCFKHVSLYYGTLICRRVNIKLNLTMRCQQHHKIATSIYFVLLHRNILNCMLPVIYHTVIYIYHSIWRIINNMMIYACAMRTEQHSVSQISTKNKSNNVKR